MRLTAKLALAQLQKNRRRTVLTLIGIVLAVAMITAVFGFAAAGWQTMHDFVLSQGDYHISFYGISSWDMDRLAIAPEIESHYSRTNIDGIHTFYFRLAEPTHNARQQMVAIVEKYDIEYTSARINKELLSLEGYEPGEYSAMIVTMAVVLLAVIVSTSVIVISNAFRVSAGERTRQFGMLKSVGATARQVRATVIYEGLLLAVLAIPLGLGVGLGVEAIGCALSKYFLATLNAMIGLEIVMNFTAPWWVIVFAALLALLTIFLSAYLPAVKASKASAIEAIRGQGEVKLKAKKVRMSKLTRKTFGVPGELALKAMTRNRRNFRATVIALASSVVLFLVGTTFGSSIMVAATELYPGVEATAVVNLSFTGYNDSTGPYYNEEAAKDPEKKQPPEFDQAMLDAYLEKLQAYGGGTKVRMYAQNFAYATYDAILTEETEFLTDGEYNQITITSLDRETYLEVIKQAGAKDGQAVVLNHMSYRFGVEPLTILRPFKLTKGMMDIITYSGEQQIEIGGAATNVPQELRLNMKGHLYVLAQNFPANEVDFYADVQDSAGFVAYAEAAYGELKHADSQYRININAQDIKGEIAATRGLVTLIMLFVYGFITMLTLIGLTNVISTISTNIRLRAREFAVLVSMGMTQRGIMRMISYESLLCGLRALVFGLVLGLGLSYLIYTQMTDLVRFPYEFPQVPVMIAALAVFTVTFVTMRYSAARVRRGNVMEAIRGSE